MIGFATPWLLAALAVLPALWWLLRLLPPQPRLVRFPALGLLAGLGQRRDARARTPWWLLLLRLAALALVIVGAAGPALYPHPPSSSQAPLLLVIDDGWAAARDWPRRQAAMADLLAEAGRLQRAVFLLGTAPPADGTPLTVQGMLGAAAAKALAQGLEPKPWPADYVAATRAVAALGHDQVIEVAWIADGLEADPAFATALQALGGGVTVHAGTAGRILRLDAPGGDDHPGLTIAALPAALDQRLAVRAIDENGRVLGREEALLPAGQGRVGLKLRLPAELRNRLVRLDIEDEASAAATLLLDEGWKRRRIGLVGDDSAAAPLLAPYYYVDRALAPRAEIVRGALSALLPRHPDALILADQPIAADMAETLRAWVEGGGVLIRFAGPAMARGLAAGGKPDPLLPVRLRPGGRALGGAMSWTEAQGLAAFPAASPFADLAVPAETKVNAQVLAEPDPALAERVWAHLADGTPLITADRRGNGWVVLVHVTANAAWSNLPLSGLFPEMLARLTALGGGGQTSVGPLPASAVLDGFGRRHNAGGVVRSLPADSAQRRPGPTTPPGLYGPEGGRHAFNLSPSLGTPRPLALPAGVRRQGLDERAIPRDLTGLALAAALTLLLLDQMLALRLRGLAAALFALTLLSQARPVLAADDFALRAGLSTRLAFVHTGDGFVDGKTRAGLTALSRVVGERSTARLDTPLAVDLERDPILFFPILYWPLSATQKPLSPAAADKLDAYLRRGGLLVLDTGAETPNPAEPAALRPLTEGLAIPPLMPVAPDHVLNRSFYLLKELPGRWDGPVWVAESGGDDRDGVSPVVVGGNDWAGAWATDSQGRPSFPCVPGGERQREMAWRFGVNLVMYALTGNYKADQVHLPAILERLGQ